MTCWPSPVGPVSVHWENGSVVALEFRQCIDSTKELTSDEKRLGDELSEYFSGKRRNFTIEPYISGSQFQNDVWQALLRIPYGQTRTYADIARAIHRPQAQRAVGTAIGQNPLPLLIPCHRVVRANGALGGFSAGEGIKPKLLRLEGAAIMNDGRRT